MNFLLQFEELYKGLLVKSYCLERQKMTFFLPVSVNVLKIIIERKELSIDEMIIMMRHSKFMF